MNISPSSKISLNRGLLALLATLIFLGLVCVPGVVAFRGQNQISSSIQWVQHTLETRNHLQKLMSFIASAESHQREYLLTGNEVHLKNIPFDVAQAYSEKAFLKELTTDNFEQQNSLQLMEPFIVERLKLLNTAIDYRKKKQITEALAQVKSGHGKEIMRSIQDLIDHMDQEESRLLVIRQEKLAHTVQKNKYLLYFLLSLELPFVLAFIYLVYRLFESVDFNQKIISKTTQGLLVYGPTGSCISMNQAAESILKIHRVEYQLLNFHQIEFWSQSRLLPVAKMTLDQKGSNELEIDYQTQDGESKRLHFSLTHFMSSGKSHLLVLIDDLTPFRREKDALTLAKLEAEKTSRFKDEFLANMSHEIRTPMNAIIGLSDLALMQGLSPKVKDYTTKINLSSKALLSLLNDILDYSKIEAGRLELEEASFSLEEVLENLSTLFALSTEQKGLELVFDVKANVSSRVIGDSLRLNQVLNNLLGNAIKFTDHGEVILRVSELERDNDSCVIRFEVVDTGIGISPENIRNLFTSFTQADSSIKRRFGGTGLGLTISKRVVEKMNGKIHLTSEVGKGSTFEFSIRLRLDKSNPVKLKDRVLPGARVLVVDDLASSRQFLNEILKSWKFEVTEASSGIEAIHAINASIEEKTPFQLMLVDWKMPGMNGIETIRKSRELIKIKDAEHMPAIIMVTAYSKEQLQREVSDVCLDSILIKPIIASNLLNAIANLNSAQKIELDNPSPKVLEESPHSNRNINILLVEDNLINQQVAREFLEREGMQVFVAQNGKECLQKMEQYPDLFHLILMDLHMPEMDGFEATRAIRQKPRWKNLPIIAMTAAALEKDRKACLDAGMNDHLAKPISRQELTKTIIHWLGAVSSDLVGGIKKSSASSLLVLPEDLPGFNFKLVMERTGLKEDLLLKILLESRQSIEEDIKKLRLEIETQDFSAAVLSAHRLKGGVSTMGAVLLSQALEQLEVELHEHKKVRNLNFLNQACEVTFSSLDILEQASKS